MEINNEKEQITLEGEIDNLLVDLDALAPQDKDYAIIVDNLAILYKLKNAEQEIINKLNLAEQELAQKARLAEQEMIYKLNLEAQEKKFKVKPDTLLIVAGNLVGILLILKFEKMDIITSKALGFVMKGRI